MDCFNELCEAKRRCDVSIEYFKVCCLSYLRSHCDMSFMGDDMVSYPLPHNVYPVFRRMYLDSSDSICLEYGSQGEFVLASEVHVDILYSLCVNIERVFVDVG